MINLIYKLKYFFNQYILIARITLLIMACLLLYWKGKEVENLVQQIDEYKKIEEEVKNQNLNVKQNVEIIKKRIESSTNYDDDRLLKQIFGDK